MKIQDPGIRFLLFIALFSISGCIVKYSRISSIVQYQGRIAEVFEKYEPRKEVRRLSELNQEQATVYSKIPQYGNGIQWPKLMTSVDRSKYPKYKSLLNVISDWNPDIPDKPELFQVNLY